MGSSIKVLVRRSPSKAIFVAKRMGIKIEEPSPHVPVVEQEQTDLS